MSNNKSPTQLKKTCRNLIALWLGKILNNLHHRDDNIKTMKKKLKIKDNGKIEGQNQILPWPINSREFSLFFRVNQQLIA